MNHPHKQQAAALGVDWTAMVRTAEPSDGEQLRECINSGQVSAAQVVAHAEAGKLRNSGEMQPAIVMPEPKLYPPGNYIHGLLAYSADQVYAAMQETARIERNRDMWKGQCARQAAALAAERAEVARLRDILHDIRFLTNQEDIYNLADVAITAPGEKHE